MKKIIFTLGLLFFSFSLYAQLKHYISFNQKVYGNFLSIDESRYKFKPSYRGGFFPLPSYRIEDKKNGVEIYAANILYDNFYNNNKKESDYYWFYNFAIGINYSYLFLETPFFSARGIAGLSYNYNKHEIPIAVFHDDDGKVFDAIMGGGEEWTWGIQTGLNATATVWKGLFINGNLRYTFNPFAKYIEHKQNMIMELGIGYKIQRRKEK